jgi:hypothetical protein
MSVIFLVGVWFYGDEVTLGLARGLVYLFLVVARLPISSKIAIRCQNELVVTCSTQKDLFDIQISIK